MSAPIQFAIQDTMASSSLEQLTMMSSCEEINAIKQPKTLVCVSRRQLQPDGWGHSEVNFECVEAYCNSKVHYKFHPGSIERPLGWRSCIFCGASHRKNHQ